MRRIVNLFFLALIASAFSACAATSTDDGNDPTVSSPSDDGETPVGLRPCLKCVSCASSACCDIIEVPCG